MEWHFNYISNFNFSNNNNIFSKKNIIIDQSFFFLQAILQLGKVTLRASSTVVLGSLEQSGKYKS